MLSPVIPLEALLELRRFLVPSRPLKPGASDRLWFKRLRKRRPGLRRGSRPPTIPASSKIERRASRFSITYRGSAPCHGTG